MHYLRKITADTRSEGDTINLTLAITLPFVSCDGIIISNDNNAILS